MTKLHYFDQAAADTDDFQLGMAIQQGYVPSTCLLGGVVVMSEIGSNKSPCSGCNGPRGKCQGKPKVRNDSAEYVEQERLREIFTATPGLENSFQRLFKDKK